MKKPSTLREQIDQASREFNSWPLTKQRSIRLEGSSEWPTVMRTVSVPIVSVALPAEMVLALETVGDGNLERGINACLAAYKALIP